MKRQPTEWETMFANHLSDKEFNTQNTQRTIQLNSKKSNPNKMWTEYLNRHFFFPREDILVTCSYSKRGSASLIIREMQIKVSMKYHLIPVTIKKTRNKRNYWGCEKREPLCSIDGNVNWLNYYGKQYGGSSKN